MTTSYQISFDFSELVLFVNYVTIYECNMIFVCDMHAWIVDRHMNGCNICFYLFICLFSNLILYVFQFQITKEIIFLFWKILTEAVTCNMNASRITEAVGVKEPPLLFSINRGGCSKGIASVKELTEAVYRPPQ